MSPGLAFPRTSNKYSYDGPAGPSLSLSLSFVTLFLKNSPLIIIHERERGSIPLNVPGMQRPSKGTFHVYPT